MHTDMSIFGGFFGKHICKLSCIANLGVDPVSTCGSFVVSKPLLLEGLTCLRKRGNRFARDQAGETKTASVARSLQGSFEGLISVSRRPGCHSVAEFHSALPKKHWSFKKAFGYCKPELQMLWQSGEQRLPHGLLLATGWADVAQPARIFGGRLQAMI